MFFITFSHAHVRAHPHTARDRKIERQRDRETETETETESLSVVVKRTRIITALTFGATFSYAGIYARYAQDIALEYCHINNMAQFCSRRAAVLKTMAVQPSVYFTPEIKAEFESQARENLAHECSLLAAYADILLPHSE